MDFSGLWRHMTLLDIILLFIAAFLAILLIAAAFNRKKHLPWNPDAIAYAIVSVIANAAIDFIGYFVNAVAFIKIFHIHNVIIDNDGLFVGLIAFLIMSLISVTVNIKIYRHWNPDGSYKSIRFLLPIFTYILFDVFLPLLQGFDYI